QTEITSDAVLDVDDVIAFLEFTEVDVERGTRRLRVRRLEPARALDFVAAEDFRVGDDHEPRGVAQEPARQRAAVGRRGQGAVRSGNVWPFALRTPHFRASLFVP